MKGKLVLVDRKRAKIHRSGSTYLQTIPIDWTRRADMRAFLNGPLEILLVRENGRPRIVIRLKAPKPAWSITKGNIEISPLPSVPIRNDPRLLVEA